MNISVGATVLFAMTGLSSVFAAPDIEANHPTLDLEEWTLAGHTFVQGTLWIFNRGTSDLHIGEIGAANPLAPPFEILGGCAHQTLAPSAHCELSIQLTTNVPGNLTESFDIASDDPDESPLTIDVRARVAARFLDGKLDGIVAPAQLKCQNVTTGQTVQRRLLDTTRWSCVQAGLLTQPDDRLIVTISGRAEADTIESAPANAAARHPGRIEVHDTDLIVLPLVLDFGRLTTLIDDTVESMSFLNNNAVPVHFIEIATTNPLAEPFFVNVDRLSHEDCDPGSDCGSLSALQIGMRPVNGVFSDSFSLTTDDPVTPQITVQVLGEGVDDMIVGTIIGLSNLVTAHATCRNVTTGQVLSGNQSWNCTENGLQAHAGDKIIMTIGGLKD